MHDQDSSLANSKRQSISSHKNIGFERKNTYSENGYNYTVVAHNQRT